jgi:FkbM family methyltransferase
VPFSGSAYVRMRVFKKAKTAKYLYHNYGLRRLLLEIWFKILDDILFNHLPYSHKHSFKIAFIYWFLRGKILRHRENVYGITSYLKDDTFYAPSLRSLSHSRQNQIDTYQSLYFYDGFFESIESSDIVFDIGGFVGSSAKAAARRAKHVYSFEPNPRSRACLKKNVADLDNVTVLPYAVGDKCQKISMNITSSNAKSSVLPLDWTSHEARNIDYTTKVDMKTVENICEELGVKTVDFLKVEAEGYEPEVVEGIGGVNVRKMSVNCSEEREGNSARQKIINMLIEKDYDVYDSKDFDAYKPNKVIYAKRL